MKTTIKSLSAEMFQGEYTGKLVIRIDGDIKGIKRNVDADGVITYEVADGNVMRMAWSAFSAQLRNAVDVNISAALNFRLDAEKDSSDSKRIAILNVICAGAEIEVEAKELDVAATDEVEAHKAISYTISKVKLSKIARLVVGQYFVANAMCIAGVSEQIALAKSMFNVEL